MKIRRAEISDIDRVMEIYAIATNYMHTHGNATQWVDGYPSREIVEQDISLGQLYLLIGDDSKVVAQFCFFVGDDPTYGYIDGAWLNDAPYGVVHRLASSCEVRGVAQISLDWCFAQHPNMRVDTHADNQTMQRALRENGYVECGEVIVHNGTRRTAYQRVG